MDALSTCSRRPLLGTDGIDVSTAHLEDDADQGALWRAGRRDAGAKVEAAFMARAVEAAILGPRNDSARQVGALLTERDELARRQAHEQTRLVFVGIGERDCATDYDVVGRCDALNRERTTLPPKPVLNADPELTNSERRAREHHELHEVAALHVEILRPVDREVLPPGGLRLVG